MSELPIKQILEGAILAADKPLPIDTLIQLFVEEEQPSRADVKLVLAEIQEDFDGRGFELKEVASGFRFQVRSEYGQWIDKLWEEKAPRYTRAFLETLALISYKQPITRGDIEEIRGVSVSTNIMRSLLEREWIRVVGHRDVPGRPAIYATTKTFLDYFDLSSLDQLPTLSEIKDLDKMNEELDLGVEDLIQPRTLDLEAEDTEAASEAADDEALDSVIEKVNTIQENIKSAMRPPEEDLEDEDEDEDEALEEVKEEVKEEVVDADGDVSDENEDSTQDDSNFVADESSEDTEMNSEERAENSADESSEESDDENITSNDEDQDGIDRV
ncbi:MAG: segregation and condensation protein B [Candidatus Azotimanducaceae bacterium]|jgi:segregation and condensation protein B